VDRADAAGLTRRAWDLDGLAAVIACEAARMGAAAEAAETAETIRAQDAGPELRLLWQSIGPFFEVLSANPPLPSVLLPEDWPMERARAAFFRLAMAVAGRARRHVEELDGGRRVVA
jgi:DNA-binding transcriptional regulator PaaX